MMSGNPRDSAKSVFMSLVGLQPGAVASPLLTWAEHVRGTSEQVAHLVLLPTRQTRSLADGLETWARSRLGITVEILPVVSDLAPHGDLPSAPQAVASWLARNQPRSVVFNAGPGLNFLVAMVSRALPPSATLLHPMEESLHVVQPSWDGETRTDLPPSALGVAALLELAKVDYTITHQIPDPVSRLFRQQRITFPDGLTRGLVLQGKDSPVSVALAFERAGFLHGLVCLERTDQEKRRRGGRELQNLRRQFPHLSLQLTVLSSSLSILRRASAERMGAINAESADLGEEMRAWMARGTRSPLPPEEGERQAATLSSGASARGMGGDGPNLVTFLGTDPSVTLISLCTHRPRKAWIAFDKTSSVVGEKASRLKDNASALPVGSLMFVPTDILGTGLHQALARAQTPMNGTRVDITPGTKAQGCSLARLPGVEVWSVQGDRGQAVCLSDATKRSLELKGPDVLTQARLQGGSVTMGPDTNEIARQGRFYGLLRDFLVRYVEENPGEGVSLRDMSCRGGKVSLHVRVELDGHEETGTLPGVGGFWWERVAAHALLSAGADEVFCGVRWSWAEENTVRDEVDVVARFGHRFVAVSCKSGHNQTLRSAVGEIEAVARSCLGRFALPMVVRPVLAEMELAKWRKRQGVAVLDLRHMADPASLRQELERIFRGLSTLGR